MARKELACNSTLCTFILRVLYCQKHTFCDSYNPGGPNLPGAQKGLETDYKRELGQHFGVVFNKCVSTAHMRCSRPRSLYTLTNMPIRRFADSLMKLGDYERCTQL